MTGGYTRGIGGLLLVGCAWWSLGALTDVAAVSPVHWGLMLPHLAVAGIPAVIGLVTAGALLVGRSSMRALLLGLGISLVQAVAVSYAAPEIEQRYSETVGLARDLQRDSAFGLKRVP